MSVAAKLAKNGSGKDVGEILSISKLAFRYDMDRATVRKRIAELGLLPVEEKAKEKLYELTPRLDAVLSETDTKLAAAKLQKELAQARIAEIKANEMEGELAPVGEFIDAVQKIFNQMFQEIAVRQPQRLGGKLAKAKTSAEAAAIIRADTAKIFATLRNDHTKFLAKGKK